MVPIQKSSFIKNTPIWRILSHGYWTFRERYIRRRARLFSSLLPRIARIVLTYYAKQEAERPRREKPALFWGTAPLINIKYHSLAMKKLGYTSSTVVSQIYSINQRDDFDYVTQELVDEHRFWGKRSDFWRKALGDYYVFLWAIQRYDVFNFYFVGGILRHTPLRHEEMNLLKLAGKKTVFTAYGADVQVQHRFRGLLFKHAQCMDYPDFVRNERETLLDVETYSRQADFILAGVDWVDYLPWWNKLISGHFAVDTDQWTPPPEWRPSSGTAERPVVVFHAPNHREIKGTRFLIQACEELKAEGVPVELRLAEKVPNSRVRELMQECDIAADQFIVGWYALFAVEAMSMEKPVLTFLRPDLLELYTVYSHAGECPIVNTPVTQIKETLRKLIMDENLRVRLGKEGRTFVRKHHSLEAIGTTFDSIYRQTWPGKNGD